MADMRVVIFCHDSELPRPACIEHPCAGLAAAKIGWSEIEYGYIVAAFQAAYGIGVVRVGKLLDQWMANVYAVISDVFPQNTIGSVTGISVLSAVGGGLLYAMAVGFILQITGSYFLIFLISAFAYLLAWVVLKLGIPEIKPVDFEANNTK